MLLDILPVADFVLDCQEGKEGLQIAQDDCQDDDPGIIVEHHLFGLIEGLVDGLGVE